MQHFRPEKSTAQFAWRKERWPSEVPHLQVGSAEAITSGPRLTGQGGRMEESA